MAHSVKDELEYLIKAAQAASKNQWTDSLVRTMTRAKGVIVTLENRLAGQLTARDKIALAMLPRASEMDDGETMGQAYKLADLFIEAGKETSNVS